MDENQTKISYNEGEFWAMMLETYIQNMREAGKNEEEIEVEIEEVVNGIIGGQGENIDERKV